MDIKELLAADPDGFRRHPWELSRLSLAESLLARHLPPVADRPGVLDVGCGDAFVVRRFAAVHGDRAFYAVDEALDDALLARLREESPAERLRFFRTLDDMDAPPNSIGMVVLLDVLEHVAEEQAFLRSLRDHPAVAADARFLISVPAYSFLYCSHDRFLGHQRRYVLSQLRKVAGDAGLRPLESGYFYHLLWWARCLQVLLETCGRPVAKEGTDLSAWNGSPFKTDLIRRVLDADGRLGIGLARLGLPLPGLSCYLVAEGAK